jgi:hypothetical protein
MKRMRDIVEADREEKPLCVPHLAACPRVACASQCTLPPL